MKWITATNLQQWADTLPARTDFPGLIADLIRASARDITSFRFPSGDKGQVRGFDGFLEATGVPPYVPEGRSIWEFGVTEAAAKPDGDYEKRTNEVDEAVRTESTFVFVSPRTWNHPTLKLQDWVAEKRKSGQWKSVEYLDGVGVETWLGDCPAVAARWARFELKLAPRAGARSTDEYWEEYATRFSPVLKEEVVLAGREAQAKSLLQRLGEGTARLPYAADSPDEVIAFAVAAIRKADPSVRLYLEARSLVLDTDDAARQVAGRTGMVFLPRGQARTCAGLLAQYGPTIVSAGADERRSGHELLARPNASTLGRALVSMGFSEKEGYDTARRCGRSLAVLARQLPSGTAETPEWVSSAEVLLPALLAGAWTTSMEADKKVLTDLASASDYETVEAPLRKLTKLKDPPIDLVADVWAMRASVDAFIYLAHRLGPEHLRRFSDVAKAVFSVVLPPPTAEEVFRPPGSRVDTHSDWLREGMMNTLLHMAVLHEQADFSAAGSSPQAYVDGIVRSLPGLSSDYRLLASLQDNLALLAEAAPIPFLEALERLLEGDAAAIKPIFDEHPGLLTSQSFHLGVLWALEVLAWDPDLLLRAAVCLARLAALDPGGGLSNRPINSLRTIFLSWAPNTDAHAKQRVGVVAHLTRTVPEIAWELLEKLLPRSMDTSSPSQRPRFRDTQKFGPEVLTYGVVWETQTAFVQMAIQSAGTEVARWQVLVSHMHEFPKKAFEDTVVALGSVLDSLAPRERFSLWDSVRKEVNRHRTFSSTEWALKDGPLEKLAGVVEKFRPQDPLLEATWLFDDWLPDVPDRSEDDDPMPAIERARIQAMDEVLQAHGVEGVVELASVVKQPQLVAASVPGLNLDTAQLAALFRAALDAGPPGIPLAQVVLSHGLAKQGDSWAEHVRAVLAERGAEPAAVAVLLMGLPESRKTWDLVSSFGQPVDDAYWKGKHSFIAPGDEQDLLFTVDKYLAVGRPMAAVQATHRRLRELPSKLLLALLGAAVPEINAVGGADTMTTYYLEGVFDELEKREDVSEDELARAELTYLAMFSRRKKPLMLHRLIVQKPELFIEAVSAVYKPASGEPAEMSEHARRTAMACYGLLEGLRILPGQTGDAVSFEPLRTWCVRVRELAARVDRSAITDVRIGHLLAHGPASSNDGAWPHEAIRQVIEELSSNDVEEGVAVERFNMRGVYSKAIGEGGDQERALAKQAREWASVAAASPRTSAMLSRIAVRWDEEAERADAHAAKESLRW